MQMGFGGSCSEEHTPIILWEETRTGQGPDSEGYVISSLPSVYVCIDKTMQAKLVALE